MNDLYDTIHIFVPEEAFERMRDICDKYGVITVADLYEIAEIRNIDYKMEDYGWIKLGNIDDHIVRANPGYMLKLPKPVALK